MRIRTHIGVSLDGFLAEADGMPTWDSLPSFTPETHGYNTFMANVDAVVMGRTCFDQGFADSGWKNGWPWPGKPVLVVTSHPLEQTDLPEGVEAVADPKAAVERLRDLGIERDVQLLGGQGAVQSFLDAGLLDELGIVVLPLVLDAGIPLFASDAVGFSRDAWRQRESSEGEHPKPPPWKLEEHDVYDDGSVHLVYLPAR